MLIHFSWIELRFSCARSRIMPSIWLLYRDRVEMCVALVTSDDRRDGFDLFIPVYNSDIAQFCLFEYFHTSIKFTQSSGQLVVVIDRAIVRRHFSRECIAIRSQTTEMMNVSPTHDFSHSEEVVAESFMKFMLQQQNRHAGALHNNSSDMDNKSITSRPDIQIECLSLLKEKVFFFDVEFHQHISEAFLWKKSREWMREREIKVFRFSSSISSIVASSSK